MGKTSRETYTFQENNINWIVNRLKDTNRVLLADETGLGKTYSAAGAIAKLAEKEKNFNVLYICSSELIAKKNMPELIDEIRRFDENLIKQDEAKKMSKRIGDRLSQSNDKEYRSKVRLRAIMPVTSFANNAPIGGTIEERERFCEWITSNRSNLKEEDQKLIGDWNNVSDRVEELVANSKCKKKDAEEDENDNNIKPLFLSFRKAKAEENVKKEKFDLIILDEYQSYEYILSESFDKNKRTNVYIDELFGDSKILMLSATPYCINSDNVLLSEKYDDFKNILCFLSNKSGTQNDIVKLFEEYEKELIYGTEFKKIEGAKDSFEGVFKSYCRRNQRTQAIKENDFYKVIEKSSLDYKDAIKKEKDIVKAYSESTQVKGSYSEGAFRDYLWPKTFSDYEKNKKTEDVADLTTLVDKEPLKESNLLCKAEAVRSCLCNDGNEEEKAVYKLAWIPASKPKYVPDENSPFAKVPKWFSKVLVFSTTQAQQNFLASYFSNQNYENDSEKIEELRTNLMKSFTTEDVWGLSKLEELRELNALEVDFLNQCPNLNNVKEYCEKNQKDSNEVYKALGHPYLCVYRMLKKRFIKETDYFRILLSKITEEVFKYLLSDNILMVLSNAGVCCENSLYRYVANGNLESVLEEYALVTKLKCDNEMSYDSYKGINKVIKDCTDDVSKIKAILTYEWKNGLLVETEKLTKLNYKEPFEKLVELINDPDMKNQNLREDESKEIKKKVNDNILCDNTLHVLRSYRMFLWTQKNCTTNLKSADKVKININELIDDQINVISTVYGNIGKSVEIESKYKCVTVYPEIEKVEDEKKERNISCIVAEDKRKRLVSTTKVFEELVLGEVSIFTKRHIEEILKYIKIDSDTSLFEAYLGKTITFRSRQGSEIEIRMGIADTYSDREDNSEGVRLQEVMNAFNSPFYPFVLFASDTAREGISFHQYCRKVFHLDIPSRPDVVIQRNGRIDRYNSLAIRQRLALWQNEDGLKIEEEDKDGLMPMWYVPLKENDGPKIEEIYYYTAASPEFFKYNELMENTKIYKQMLGSMLPGEVGFELNKRFPNADLSSISLNLLMSIDKRDKT